jgi:hypothetical protein
MTEYSVGQAHAHAKEWCSKNAAWVPICDVPDIGAYYVQWEELSARDQKGWGSQYAYEEFGTKKAKVEMGYITGKGEFKSSALDVPLGHNLMTVVRVGVKTARQLRAKALAPAGTV